MDLEVVGRPRWPHRLRSSPWPLRLPLPLPLRDRHRQQLPRPIPSRLRRTRQLRSAPSRSHTDVKWHTPLSYQLAGLRSITGGYRSSAIKPHLEAGPGAWRSGQLVKATSSLDLCRRELFWLVAEVVLLVVVITHATPPDRS